MPSLPFVVDGRGGCFLFQRLELQQQALIHQCVPRRDVLELHRYQGPGFQRHFVAGMFLRRAALGEDKLSLPSASGEPESRRGPSRRAAGDQSPFAGELRP